MPKPDYDSPTGDLYMRLMREMEPKGANIMSRPAVSSYERERAKLVRVRLDRGFFSLVQQEYIPVSMCTSCGCPICPDQDIVPAKAIWYNGSKAQEFFRHVDCIAARGEHG